MKLHSTNKEEASEVRREHVEIWLCVDCMFAEVNGEFPEDEERAKEIEEGFKRLEAQGIFYPDFSNDEGDGYDEFSWAPCDCCGSDLGGSRYRYALFLAR